jgi:hypothetical protein
VSRFYEAVGRLVVYFVWMRFGRQIKIGIAVTLAAIIVGAFLAAAGRDVEEG